MPKHIGLLVLFCSLVHVGRLFVLRGFEQRAAQAEFQSSASERLDHLAGSMRLSLVHLDALGAYFDATPRVDRGLFHQLVRPLLDEIRQSRPLSGYPGCRTLNGRP